MRIGRTIMWYGIIALELAISTQTQAVEYICSVQRKVDSERVYSDKMINKYRYTVKIEDQGDAVFVSRCSVTTSTKSMTCDRYRVDKVVFDKNVKIKKYYMFYNQFDVQIFPNLAFVENNGRGSISYGKCEVSAP